MNITIFDRSVLSRALMLFGFGLLVAFGSAYGLAESGVVGTPENPTYWPGIIGFIFPFIILGYLAIAREHLGRIEGHICYWLFCVIEGMSLSYIFLYYELGSIADAFLVAGVTCLLMGLIGYFIKIDISSWGSILFYLLIGYLLVTIFAPLGDANIIDIIIVYGGITLFSAFMIYDLQKLRARSEVHARVDSRADESSADVVLGAIDLYLNFVNLFMLFLRFFGVEKDIFADRRY